MNPQEKAKQLYTHDTDLYQKLFIDLLHYQKGIEAFFTEHMSLFRASGTILDAGTGTGTLIKALYTILPNNAFKKIHFTAFDITPSMLSKLKKWVEKNRLRNIEIFQSDVLKLNKTRKSNPYDMIMSAAMLEYLSKADFLTELLLLKKQLEKNGTLLLFISKKSLLNYFLIKLWWKANLYMKQEISTELKNAGFEEISFHKFPRPYAYLNLWGYIIEAK